ncbi:MAG: polyhydroxyalkanoic acid system family protein [Steroidobacteraceae bacterium]
MSTTVIRRAHALTHSQALDAAKAVAAEMEQKYAMRSRWVNSEELHFERAGLHGQLRVHEKEITLKMTFGLLMLAFKDKVLGIVESRLDKALTKPQAGTRTARARPAKKSSR